MDHVTFGGNGHSQESSPLSRNMRQGSSHADNQVPVHASCVSQRPSACEAAGGHAQRLRAAARHVYSHPSYRLLLSSIPPIAITPPPVSMDTWHDALALHEHTKAAAAAMASQDVFSESAALALTRDLEERLRKRRVRESEDRRVVGDVSRKLLDAHNACIQSAQQVWAERIAALPPGSQAVPAQAPPGLQRYKLDVSILRESLKPLLPAEPETEPAAARAETAFCRDMRTLGLGSSRPEEELGRFLRRFVLTLLRIAKGRNWSLVHSAGDLWNHHSSVGSVEDSGNTGNFAMHNRQDARKEGGPPGSITGNTSATVYAAVVVPGTPNPAMARGLLALRRTQSAFEPGVPGAGTGGMGPLPSSGSFSSTGSWTGEHPSVVGRGVHAGSGSGRASGAGVPAPGANRYGHSSAGARKRGGTGASAASLTLRDKERERSSSMASVDEVDEEGRTQYLSTGRTGAAGGGAGGVDAGAWLRRVSAADSVRSNGGIVSAMLPALSPPSSVALAELPDPNTLMSSGDRVKFISILAGEHSAGVKAAQWADVYRTVYAGVLRTAGQPAAPGGPPAIRTAAGALGQASGGGATVGAAAVGTPNGRRLGAGFTSPGNSGQMSSPSVRYGGMLGLPPVPPQETVAAAVFDLRCYGALLTRSLLNRFPWLSALPVSGDGTGSSSTGGGVVSSLGRSQSMYGMGGGSASSGAGSGIGGDAARPTLNLSSSLSSAVEEGLHMLVHDTLFGVCAASAARVDIEAARALEGASLASLPPCAFGLSHVWCAPHEHGCSAATQPCAAAQATMDTALCACAPARGAASTLAQEVYAPAIAALRALGGSSRSPSAKLSCLRACLTAITHAATVEKELDKRIFAHPVPAGCIDADVLAVAFSPLVHDALHHPAPGGDGVNIIIPPESTIAAGDSECAVPKMAKEEQGKTIDGPPGLPASTRGAGDVGSTAALSVGGTASVTIAPVCEDIITGQPQPLMLAQVPAIALSSRAAQRAAWRSAATPATILSSAVSVMAGLASESSSVDLAPPHENIRAITAGSALQGLASDLRISSGTGLLAGVEPGKGSVHGHPSPAAVGADDLMPRLCFVLACAWDTSLGASPGISIGSVTPSTPPSTPVMGAGSSRAPATTTTPLPTHTPAHTLRLSRPFAQLTYMEEGIPPDRCLGEDGYALVSVRGAAMHTVAIARQVLGQGLSLDGAFSPSKC